jgi:hypothetical protein
VKRAVAEGARDLRAVKLFTRLGMGPCQGCNCGPGAALYLSEELGCPLGALDPIRPRPPVKPAVLGALADVGTLPTACNEEYQA